VRVWRWGGHLRHALVLRLSRRRNYTFTQFCRLPTQMDFLAGPVLDATGAGSGGVPPRIVVFGCSNGSEAYSLASALRARRPGSQWEIECFDIDAGMVAQARAARYPVVQVTQQRNVPPAFLARTFDARGDEFVVQQSLTMRVRFAVGDVLDASLIARLTPADLVLGQNFLYHLRRRDAVRAFHHLVRLLKPGGALAVDGADLDLRTRLTVEAGLAPWPDAIERIHEEARVERGYAWPGIYWGLEPYDRGRADAARRYATIFAPPPTIAARQADRGLIEQLGTNLASDQAQRPGVTSLSANPGAAPE
jgi:chemotaxis methyl-accepting protein methylase